jgi:hypothetical protein
MSAKKHRSRNAFHGGMRAAAQAGALQHCGSLSHPEFHLARRRLELAAEPDLGLRQVAGELLRVFVGLKLADPGEPARVAAVAARFIPPSIDRPFLSLVPGVA